MKKGAWARKIRAACEASGTYRPYFEDTIRTLAAIMEKRDEAEEAYKKMGSEPIVEYTNKMGATNWVKNPALTMWDDLNKSALAYWRDLGLTPAGLKKIDQKAMKKVQKDALSEALKDLGG